MLTGSPSRALLFFFTRPHSFRARFFDRPHWPRGWNRLPQADPHIEMLGFLVVSLRGENCGFWSPLGWSGRKSLILAINWGKFKVLLKWNFRLWDFCPVIKFKPAFSGLAVVCEMKPNKTKPNQMQRNKAKPNQTKPNPTKPNLSKPKEKKRNETQWNHAIRNQTNYSAVARGGPPPSFFLKSKNRPVWNVENKKINIISWEVWNNNIWSCGSGHSTSAKTPRWRRESVEFKGWWPLFHSTLGAP